MIRLHLVHKSICFFDQRLIFTFKIPKIPFKLSAKCRVKNVNNPIYICFKDNILTFYKKYFF